MQEIDRNQVKEMIDNEGDLTIVEVLGEQQFNKFHLPGAINVPLGEDFDEKIQNTVSAKSSPVIVYCMDEACDASPKAAERMERLGYQQVYDYTAGKMDWQQAGLPTETG